MAKEVVPAQLLQFLLPGLQMAVNANIDEMNRICSLMGNGITFQLTQNGNGHVDALQGLPTHVTERSRKGWTDESRRRMSEIQKRAWAKKRGATKQKNPNKSHLGKNASRELLISFARSHGGMFSAEQFKRKYPKLHMRVLGNMVMTGAFKKKAEGEYELAKGE